MDKSASFTVIDFNTAKHVASVHRVVGGEHDHLVGWRRVLEGHTHTIQLVLRRRVDYCNIKGKL